MEIKGHLDLYIKAECQDSEPTYIHAFMDFTKPVTRRKLKRILKSHKKHLKSIGITTDSIGYISRAEYEGEKNE